MGMSQPPVLNVALLAEIGEDAARAMMTQGDWGYLLDKFFEDEL